MKVAQNQRGNQSHPQHQQRRHQQQPRRQDVAAQEPSRPQSFSAEQAPAPPGDYGFDNAHVCSSPRSSFSEHKPDRPSMAHHAANGTITHPNGVGQADSPAAISNIANLSLGAKLTSTARRQPALSKRPAEAELTSTSPQNKRSTCGPHGIRSPKPEYSSVAAGRRSPASGKACPPRGPLSRLPKPPQARDSGYESTRQVSIDAANPTVAVANISQQDAVAITNHKPKDRKRKYAGLILEPDASPISQEQLAMEVKGIYGGLVLVEAKCINIDAAQAADPNTQLNTEQWQALTALHRTLLYEHHDFLMATQHPSANDSLKGLATKYSMPARMWKHGIHAFLEVLRHRRPASQDYMLAFIYLAYQMMALLYETVESFKDTWIECLGDLARYRMAIEEDREAHATWGGVAARWYTLANDRHPAVGRLNHHLGILERPSLRKMYFYAKSLTCVLPFPNARDSMATLCDPILYDDNLMKSSNQPAEARIMYFQAMLFSDYAKATTYSARDEALALLDRESSSFIARVGVSLAVTNIAALFQYGSSTNALRATFAHAISRSLGQSQSPSSQPTQDEPYPDTSHLTTAVPTALEFCYSCFSFGLKQTDDLTAIHNVSPYVHVMLSWLHGVISLRPWMVLEHSPAASFTDIEGVLVGGAHMPWGPLALFLNTLIVYYPLSSKIINEAGSGKFPAEESEDYRPLPEDFMIRGLIWSQFYHRRDWFEGKLEDDSRHIENDATRKMRSERIQWLGLILAQHTPYLRFDLERQRFFAMTTGGPHLESPGSLIGVMQSSLTTASTMASTSPLKSMYSSIGAATGAATTTVNGSLSPSSATLSAMSEGVDSAPDSWTNVDFRSKRTGMRMPIQPSSLFQAGEPSAEMR